MLGETFELVRDGVRFVAEKTSHHPPVIASHADGPGWSMWQTSAAKNKLAGMSLEITPVGATFIELERTGERFRYEKPSSYIRNLVAGTKYLETIGTMDVVNLTTVRLELFLPRVASKCSVDLFRPCHSSPTRAGSHLRKAAGAAVAATSSRAWDAIPPFPDAFGY
jgi:hypothetical protein